MIGVKPLFSGNSLADGASANFDVIVAAPNGSPLAQTGLHYQLLRIDTHYQYYKRDGNWNFEPVKTTTRVTDGAIDVAPLLSHMLPIEKVDEAFRIAHDRTDNALKVSIKF